MCEGFSTVIDNSYNDSNVVPAMYIDIYTEKVKMKKNSIVYFDLVDLNYASFFINGFLHNSRVFDYNFSISKSCPTSLARFASDLALQHILLFQATINGEAFIFCVDTADSCGNHPHILQGYNIFLLENTKHYFKVNYNKAVVENDLNFKEYTDKILPIPTFFPLKFPKPWQLLPKLEFLHPSRMLSPRSIRRMKTLLTLCSLEKLRRLRDTPKDIDIFFVVNYYGTAVHAAEDEFRYQIMREIADHKDIKAITGFSSHSKLPGKFASFASKHYLHPRYLHQLSRARVAIYVRGAHDCLSFKFGQMMALGMPIVGQSLYNNSENMYQYPYFKDQFAYNDPALIIQKAVALLNNPEELSLLAEANAHTFDTAFTPEAITARILEQLRFYDSLQIL